ncbi:MAG: hypothetical protein HN348_22280 [Proteobacteria bacterium]|nr:hypothetical protein [Pseudomonadota bacterium]
MAIAAYADPVIHAEPSTRVAYLRKVAALTFVGLILAAFSGTVSASVIFLLEGAASSRMVQLVVIFGSYFIAHFVARRMVYSSAAPVKYLGFMAGSVFQGIAMGYLLLAAILASLSTFGTPFVFVAQALFMTGLVAVGLLLYLMTGPKDLSYVKGALSMLFLPMMALMAISFVFSSYIGGPLGIAMTLLFVVISVAGLLYQLNQIIHKLPATMYVEGAFEVTLGLLVLFWNILVLLMRLQRR